MTTQFEKDKAELDRKFNRAREITGGVGRSVFELVLDGLDVSLKAVGEDEDGNQNQVSAAQLIEAFIDCCIHECGQLAYLVLERNGVTSFANLIEAIRALHFAELITLYTEDDVALGKFHSDITLEQALECTIELVDYDPEEARERNETLFLPHSEPLFSTVYTKVHSL